MASDLLDAPTKMRSHIGNNKNQQLNGSTVSLPAERLRHLGVPSTPTINNNHRKELFQFKKQQDQTHRLTVNNTSATQQPAAEISNHLTIPKSTSNQISLASSFDLSVIDMYGSPQHEDDEDAEEDADFSDEESDQTALTINNLNKTLTSELHQIPSTPTKASAHKPSIAQPQQQSPNSQINLSEYDRYGFRKHTRSVSESQYDNWFQTKYQPHLIRRKKKWVQLFQKSGLATPDTKGLKQVRFPPKSEKLKRFVRKGIPAEWRGEAWWFFAKGQDILQEGLYDDLVERSSAFKGKDLDIIERDLNRTFPDNLHFKVLSEQEPKEPEMIGSLRRVLVAFALYQPSIGYCQSLNFITGLLLLFMSEERSFWMLVLITGRLLPGLHEMNLEGVNVSQGVLMLGLKEYVPSMFKRIMDISFDQEADLNGGDGIEFLRRIPPVMLTTSSWFMSVFVGSLPIETTLRVWDCLFYEDSVFIFKIGLSLFKLIEAQIPQSTSLSNCSDIDEMEIFTLIQNYPKTLIDPSVLFDVIFASRNQFNGLSQQDIIRCRNFVTEKRQTASKNKTGMADLKISRRLLFNEDLWSDELYGFRSKSGAGSSIVRWNRDLSERVKRRMRR